MCGILIVEISHSVRNFLSISCVYITKGYNDNRAKERVNICGGFDEQRGATAGKTGSK